ncbi:hypothetical protein [Megamonas hypermegale]|uniref:hypothetical protein n=1 Tax=Megamonas hypermegale TaxID=158847 RepID=UPI00194EAC80|nr:hypothetical protein [Megamonas hypermegale]
MATKSILKNIVIKDKKSCRSLINALENAKGKKRKEVIFSRGYKTATEEDIDKIFL